MGGLNTALAKQGFHISNLIVGTERTAQRSGE